jgi:hypothetical protein
VWRRLHTKQKAHAHGALAHIHFAVSVHCWVEERVAAADREVMHVWWRQLRRCAAQIHDYALTKCTRHTKSNRLHNIYIQLLQLLRKIGRTARRGNVSLCAVFRNAASMYTSASICAACTQFALYCRRVFALISLSKAASACVLIDDSVNGNLIKHFMNYVEAVKP